MGNRIEYDELVDLSIQELAAANGEMDNATASIYVARAQVYATLANARAIRSK